MDLKDLSLSIAGYILINNANQYCQKFIYLLRLHKLLVDSFFQFIFQKTVISHKHLHLVMGVSYGKVQVRNR